MEVEVRYIKYVTFSLDFDLDPMMVIVTFDLDVVKMYLFTENDIPNYIGSKEITQTERHTNRAN